jgi:NAD-dependent dihydropyrimidine dehydrogenase PreA subunit
VPYFVTEACIGELDRSCIEECPVDCIYEGASKMYINPKECIDCGACEPACPVQAIVDDRTAPTHPHRDDNARFFFDVLPGNQQPIGNRGGFGRLGKLDLDTELAAELARGAPPDQPKQPEQRDS